MSDLENKETKGTPVATENPTPKRNLGMTKDTVGGSAVPIPPPHKLAGGPTEQFTTGYQFPLANLVAVKFDPEKKMKISGVDTTKPVLNFIFKDNKDRVFTHIEFPLDDDDTKFDDKLDWQRQRVKHIWDEAIGASLFPEEGVNGADFAELFKDMADKFNGLPASDGKPVYTKTLLYIKCTYNKDRLQFPLFPNFVQKAKVGDKIVPVITLSINMSKDRIEQTASKPAVAGFGGGASFGAVEGGDPAGYPDI